MEQKLVVIIFAIFVGFGVVGVGGVWLLSVPLRLAESPKSVSTSTPQPDATTPPQESRVLGARTKELNRDKLYSLINGYRREKDLPVLRIHPLLEQSSADKLYDMQQNNYWTHYDPQGREPWYLFVENGYHYELAGENLSFGYTTEWKVFSEWQKSPEHNAQLLEPRYEHMGIATDCTSYHIGESTTCIVVLHLGKQLL